MFVIGFQGNLYSQMDNSSYVNTEDNLFTGDIEKSNKSRKKGRIDSFENGNLVKTSFFYTKGNQRFVYQEDYYHINSKKQKSLKFYYNTRNHEEFFFDENELKSEYNYYKNGILNIHETYLNGKKHGKWRCVNFDDSICEREYDKGKLIKDCK